MSTARFGYDSAEASELEGEVVALDPARGFWTDPDLDYSAVAAPQADPKWGTAPLDSAAVLSADDEVFVIHHPKRGPKHVSLVDNDVISVDARLVQYRADTEHGSSGAPVFDRRWRVVAMHRRGGPIVNPATGARELRNEGVRAAAIASDLARRRA